MLPSANVIMKDSKHPNKNIKTISSNLKRYQSWLDKFLLEEMWIDIIKATSNYLANFD